MSARLILTLMRGSDMCITKEGIEVKAGQVWRDLDKRMRGRTVVVEWVSKDGTIARVKGVRSTQLSISRMHKHSTGWALVKDAP